MITICTIYHNASKWFFAKSITNITNKICNYILVSIANIFRFQLNNLNLYTVGKKSILSANNIINFIIIIIYILLINTFIIYIKLQLFKLIFFFKCLIIIYHFYRLY